jgi:hypothetical protein
MSVSTWMARLNIMRSANFGGPVKGVQEGLKQISFANWKIIIIFTTRANTKLVSEYLLSLSIPFDYMNENPDQPKNAIGGKPYAEAYIEFPVRFVGGSTNIAQPGLFFGNCPLHQRAAQFLLFEQTDGLRQPEQVLRRLSFPKTI